MSFPRRIGLIVPSSNTTMETELPELFRRDGGETASGSCGTVCGCATSEVTVEEPTYGGSHSMSRRSRSRNAPVEAIAYACLGGGAGARSGRAP